MCLARVIYLQINANRVCAFLILAHIGKIELLVLSRLLPSRIVGVRNERLAPLILRQRFKKIDNLIEFVWICHI